MPQQATSPPLSAGTADGGAAINNRIHRITAAIWRSPRTVGPVPPTLGLPGGLDLGAPASLSLIGADPREPT